MWMGVCSDYLHRDLVRTVPRGRATTSDEAATASNLALLGLADALTAQDRRHIMSTALEHKAVLEPLD